jgi:hypothetical protein
MIQAPREACLILPHVAVLHALDGIVEDFSICELDGDLTLSKRIHGEIDDAAASLAEFPDDPVFADLLGY